MGEGVRVRVRVRGWSPLFSFFFLFYLFDLI